MKMQDYYIAAFSVCPFIYDTQNRSLQLITEINLSFDLNENVTTKSASLSRKRYDMESVVKSLVVNPKEIATLYPETDEMSSTKSTTIDRDVDYLIITDESLIDFFVPLKAWKIRKGINTVILSTNYIYSNYTGTTNQLKIKRCLQDYYENKNLKWSLLGGDNTVVPVQGCYGKYSSSTDFTIPCDLFYSCFDNAFDWDADNDGIIGETTDNIDMAPEIYISRAPIRTEAHVTTFVNKVIGYETNPASTSYVETMLLTGTNLFDSYNSAGESDAHWKNEQMYLNYISPQWSGIKTKFYDTGTDFTGGASYDLTASNLQSKLNNGYHFVHMATHGGQTSWSMETGISYHSINAQNQTNSKHSLIVTMACNTNAFDDAKFTSDPCLSEAFLRNPNGGCILYWGSSRHGWSVSSWDFSSRFFQNFFSGSPTAESYKFGAVTAISKSYYISSSSSYSSAKRWLQFSQNAIGDPELPIYTKNPSNFTTISVTDNGTN
ncbi:MAG: C25 family cysteine peptidase, partial [Cyclobacteriaceae bacterium]